MADKHNLCVIRSLNYLRRIHLPSYVAMRVFALSIASDARSSWLDRYISRKSTLHKKSRYMPFRVLKNLDFNNTAKYRDFWAQSPTIALSEAWLLNELSLYPNFQPRSCVYSYLWPKANSGTSYRFFAQGYHERNKDISGALDSAPGLGMLVTDIKSFYPSIPHAELLPKLETKLAAFGIDNKVKRIATDLFKTAMSIMPIGIPVGPSISHILANIFLEDFDDLMNKRYPGRYFRYVDDIVIVDEFHNLSAAKELIAQSLNAIGLKINEDKTDILRADHWKQHFPKYSMGGGSFHDLQRTLQIFLMLYPSRFQQLKVMFSEAGINLPLHKYIADSRYQRLRKYVLHNLSLLWNCLFLKKQNLLDTAISLRDKLFDELASNCKRLDSNSPVIRRWQIQKLRHRVNPLIYLLPASDYPKLAAQLEHIPEFRDTVAVLKALSGNDVSMLLHMPGAPIRTFIEIAKELGLKKRPYPYAEIPDPHVDSLCELLLHDLIEISPDIIQTSKYAEILSFCAALPSSNTKRNDVSYLDEIRCLQLNVKRDEVMSFVKTRFDSNEESLLSALSLGDDYYYR